MSSMPINLGSWLGHGDARAAPARGSRSQRLPPSDESRVRYYNPPSISTRLDHVTLSLLQRVASNDPGAVKAVLDQFGGLVWSLARRFCFNDAEAEDAVQEIFTEIWKSSARFDPKVASEATFIAMIARRRLIDRARKSARRTDTAQLPERVTSAEPMSDAPAELRDEAASAAKALAQLSNEQQRVLRLSIYQGLSHERIADATGLPLGTVKTHLHATRSKLKAKLGGFV